MSAKTPREDPRGGLSNLVPVGSNPSPAATFQVQTSPLSGPEALHEAPSALSGRPTGGPTPLRYVPNPDRPAEPDEFPSWRHAAKYRIGEACYEFIDFTGELPRPAMAEPLKKLLLRMVNADYPFGQRANFPYKVWLSEMKHLRDQLYPPAPLPVDTGLFALESSE